MQLILIFFLGKGGLKAVVWTDVIQTVIMFGAILVILVKGTIDVGGLGVVWERNWESGRIELPAMTWDPTVRVSMLSMFVGSSLFLTQVISGNQVIVQRYLSLPDLKAVKKALILFIIGIIILNAVCFYNGLLIYARFHDCDPLTTKLTKAKDQLMPLFAAEVLSAFPGAPGLFVAGVFSAALSSLSTGLNSLSAVLLEDYIKPYKTKPLTEFQTAILMRVSVVALGILCVGLVFVVERMGAVVQLSVTLGSITMGPLLGLFIIGLLLPWINSKSALAGSIISFGIMSWICIKAQLAIAAGELVYVEKPVSTAGCTYAFDELASSVNATISEHGSKTFSQYIYHMSFVFYAFVGALCTIIFAFIASFIYGRNDPSKMNVELFSPFIRRFIKPEEYESVQPEEEKTIIMGFEVKDAIKN